MKKFIRCIKTDKFKTSQVFKENLTSIKDVRNIVSWKQEKFREGVS